MTQMALKRHYSVREDLSPEVNRPHYKLEAGSRWFEYGHSYQYLEGAALPLPLFYFLKNPTTLCLYVQIYNNAKFLYLLTFKKKTPQSRGGRLRGEKSQDRLVGSPVKYGEV